jgi:hypothetical protein
MKLAVTIGILSGTLLALFTEIREMVHMVWDRYHR